MSSLFVIWFGAWIAYVRQIPPQEAWEIPVAAVIAIVVSVSFQFLVDPLSRRFERGTEEEEPVDLSSGSVRSRFLALGLLALLGFLIPEAGPALSLLFISMLLGCCPLRRAAAGRLSRYLGLYRRTAWLVLAAGLLYWAYWELEPYLQFKSFPAHGATGAARWLGFDAGSGERGIALTRFGVTAMVGHAPRHAFLFPVALAFGIQGCALFMMRLRPVFKALLLFLLLGIHLLYREAVVLGTLVYRFENEVPGSEERLFFEGAAFCPLFLFCHAVLLAAARRHRYRERPADAVRSRSIRFSKVAAILSASGAAVVVFSLFWNPPGEARQGRIAVDGMHSEWEWTDVPLDRRIFGTKTTYNFVSMMRLLRQYFPVVDNVAEGELDAKLLSRYDVWILKTPTRGYTSSEREALRRYVEEGGSIWFIGEHTDIFGINTHLNQVSEQFGIRFVADAADDDISIRRSDHQLWTRSGRWHHPIVSRVPEFLFATSCSIEADPLRCRPVMVGTGLYSDSPDYSRITFFGDMQKDAVEPYGRFFQCVSARIGKGRVAAFTDSTVFSTFSMQMKGKPELALGTVNWLNHSSRSALLSRLLLFSGIAVLMIGIYRCLREKVFLSSPMAVSIAAGVILGFGGARFAAAAWPETYPEPEWTCKRTAFLPGSETALPFRGVVQHDEVSSQVFSTFYVWFQKAEILPFTIDSLDQADGYPMIVLLDKGMPLTPVQLNLLENHMAEGGSVWLLTSSPGTARQLLDLEMFRDSCRIKEFDSVSAERVRAFDEVHARWLFMPAATFGVEGLVPLLTSEDGVVIHGLIKAGKGALVLTTEPGIFSNASMGSPTDIPTEMRFALFEVQWATIDRCLE